jgi:hypothetical protein
MEASATLTWSAASPANSCPIKAVQQSATSNVRKRAFLRQIHRKPEIID